MASVYRIRQEVRPTGVRYVVDYRDNARRRSTRRFKKARDAEAFKKQVEASTYTYLPPPRPVHLTFAQWAEEWFWPERDAVRSYKLHELTIETVIHYVERLQAMPIPSGRRSSGQPLRNTSIRNKVGLLS